MKKVENYRQHAAECRSMANRSRTPEEKEMLSHMATTWDSLATERQVHIARRERIAELEKIPASVPIERLNSSNDE